MAVNVHGDKSLMFKTGVDNSGLRKGSRQSKGILKSLKGWIMKLGLFAGITIALRQLKKVTLDYAQTLEKAMNEVSTLSSEITNNFEHYRDQVVQLSTEVVDSADKLSEGLYQIVSAGYDGEDALHLLGVAAKSATAGVTETGTAASVLTSAMTAWSKKTEEAESVANDLFNTVKGGVVRLEQIEGQLGKVASVAAPVGIEMDNILAGLQTMTKRGMPVEESMQRMRAAIRDFAREFGTEWTENISLQEKAIEVYEESEGKFKQVLQTMTDEGAQFVNIMGKYMDSARGDLESYSDTAGDMKDAWKKMTSSSINQSKILADRIKAKFVPLGNTLNNIWNNLIGNINSMLESTTDHVEQIDEYRHNLKTLEDLRDRYEELSQKTKKSREEKEELQKIMNDIAEFVPEVVAKWDAEKGAIELNTGALEDNIEKRKEGLKWRDAEIEKIDEFMKWQEQQIRLRGKEPQWEPMDITLSDEQSIKRVERNIELLKNRRKEVAEELNQLAERDELTEKQIERLEYLRGLRESINKRLETHKQHLKDISKEEEKQTKKVENKFPLRDQEVEKAGMFKSVIREIGEQIRLLEEASDTYNKNERRRLKKLIEWWQDLYSAISDARLMGHEKWSQQQAEKIAGEGLEDYKPWKPEDFPGLNLDQTKEEFEGMNDSISEAQTLFYRLSDTLGGVDDDLGNFLKKISDAGMGLSNVLSSLSGGGTISSLSGALGAAGGMLSLYKPFVETGIKIQDIIMDWRTDYDDNVYDFRENLEAGGLRDETRNSLLKQLQESNRKISAYTYDMVRSMGSSDHSDRFRDPEGEPEGEDQSPLRGAIRGVTEKTAGLIAGRMHSVQMHVAEHVEIANNSLTTLRQIERNTLYNKKLYELMNEGTIEVRSTGT